MTSGDTIFALSSGTPPAAIAVMRVSGPQAGDTLAAMAGKLPSPRRASLRTLRAADGSLLDRAMVLWLPGPSTATGEDIAELHLHGSRATVAAVAAALTAQGLRQAEGGEFTRRALENGCIDLAQAEGLAELLMAETEQQRRVALATAEGAVGRAFDGWYARLVEISALIEARLDHADEEDVKQDAGEIDVALGALQTELDEVLARPSVERLREGPVVALAGPPNAGKSSLFNALVERDAAIVTPIAGTTRDLIEAAVVRQGRCFRLVDTAGLTRTDDPVEQIGVDRALTAQRTADLVLWLGDDPPPNEDALWVNARCDLPGREHRDQAAVNVSVLRPNTIAALWDTITDRMTDIVMPGAAFLLNGRQREGVATISAQLEEAHAASDELIKAESVRVGLEALDRLSGRHAPEAMLTALFSRFCIGK